MMITAVCRMLLVTHFCHVMHACMHMCQDELPLKWELYKSVQQPCDDACMTQVAIIESAAYMLPQVLCCGSRTALVGGDGSTA